MDELGFFLIIVAAILLVVFWWVADHVGLFSRGGWSRLKNYFDKDAPGDGAEVGIRAVTILAVVVAALSLVVFSRDADASPLADVPDIKFFDSGYFRAGVELSKVDPSPQCVAGGANNRATSTIELSTEWLRYKRVASNLYLQHKSCVVNEDRNSYEAIGMDVKVYLW